MQQPTISIARFTGRTIPGTGESTAAIHPTDGTTRVHRATVLTADVTIAITGLAVRGATAQEEATADTTSRHVQQAIAMTAMIATTMTIATIAIMMMTIAITTMTTMITIMAATVTTTHRIRPTAT